MVRHAERIFGRKISTGMNSIWARSVIFHDFRNPDQNTKPWQIFGPDSYPRPRSKRNRIENPGRRSTSPWFHVIAFNNFEWKPLIRNKRWIQWFLLVNYSASWNKFNFNWPTGETNFAFHSRNSISDGTRGDYYYQRFSFGESMNPWTEPNVNCI